MSADSEKALAGFKKKQKLNFGLLSDPAHKTIEAFGVWRTKKFLGRWYQGIVRSTFLIGSDGTIEKVWDPANAKGHAAEVLQAMKAAA